MKIVCYALTVLLLCNVGTLGILAYVLWLNRREREELYNRIMAGSLPEFREFKEYKNSKPPPRVGNSVKRAFQRYYAQVIGGEQ